MASKEDKLQQFISTLVGKDFIEASKEITSYINTHYIPKEEVIIFYDEQAEMTPEQINLVNSWFEDRDELIEKDTKE